MTARKPTESSIIRKLTNGNRIPPWFTKICLAILGAVALLITSFGVSYETNQNTRAEDSEHNIVENRERIIKLETQWGYVQSSLERIEGKL